jgi:hypothetical protein
VGEKEKQTNKDESHEKMHISRARPVLHTIVETEVRYGSSAAVKCKSCILYVCTV